MAGGTSSGREGDREGDREVGRNRVRFIEHRGQRILLQDFSGIRDSGEAIAAIEEAIRFVDELSPEGSLLVLTDATGSQYDAGVLDALKRLARHHHPYVHASAVVTSSPLQRIAAAIVALFAGRRIETFGEVEAAKDWLAEQAE